MLDSDEEERETYSRHATKKKKKKKKQQAYPKIKCLKVNTVPILTANFREVCSHDAMNHSTVARWFK